MRPFLIRLITSLQQQRGLSSHWVLCSILSTVFWVYHFI